MGMFSSLFGSSGSDEADQMRQKALDAFNSVKTPELSALQVQLDKYVQTGQITPEQAEASLLNSNAFNDIKSDPEATGAQKTALQQLQSISTEGLTAIDKAKIQDITNATNTMAKGRKEAVLQNARERGIGGSGLELTGQLTGEQEAADRASAAGTQVAADAQARALQAIMSSGQLGGQIEQQQYGEQANKAQAQNAIDEFNAKAQASANLENVRAANAAQAQNLAEKQRVSDVNTQTGNAQTMYNAQQNQQIYEDQLKKAAGQAGIYQNWGNAAQTQKDKEYAADVGLTTGLIKGGATLAGSALAGPVGGAAMAGTTSQSDQFGKVYKPTDKEMGFAKGGEVSSCMAEGGEVSMDKDEFEKEHRRLLDILHQGTREEQVEEAANQKEEMKEKGIEDFRSGGEVPGQAPYSGDDKRNDIVNAKLSPGEVVVPRSAVNDSDEFERFMTELKEKHEPKMKKEEPIKHEVEEVKATVAEPDKKEKAISAALGALTNLHNRVSKLEGN
jgi:hypothetical protein